MKMENVEKIAAAKNIVCTDINTEKNCSWRQIFHTLLQNNYGLSFIYNFTSKARCFTEKLRCLVLAYRELLLPSY